MELVRYEIRVGMFKGILFGMREYEFMNQDVREKDVVFYFGIFQLVITLIYN